MSPAPALAHRLLFGHQRSDLYAQFLFKCWYKTFVLMSRAVCPLSVYDFCPLTHLSSSTSMPITTQHAAPQSHDNAVSPPASPPDPTQRSLSHPHLPMILSGATSLVHECLSSRPSPIEFSSAIDAHNRMHTTRSKVRTKLPCSCFAPCGLFQSTTSARFTSPSSRTSLSITTQDAAPLSHGNALSTPPVPPTQHSAHGPARMFQSSVSEQHLRCTHVSRPRPRPPIYPRAPMFGLLCTLLGQKFVLRFRVYAPPPVPTNSHPHLPH